MAVATTSAAIMPSNETPRDGAQGVVNLTTFW